MIANKKIFLTGLGLMVAFVIVLIIFFSPVFHGQNGLNYLDSLYNSISKGSAYYIPKLKNEIQPAMGTTFETTLSFKSADQAQQSSLLFQKAGAMINLDGTALKVSGDLGQILANCLEDADAILRRELLNINKPSARKQRRNTVRELLRSVRVPT